MNDVIGDAFVVAIVVLIAFELWLGFAKGYVHTGYGGRTQRATQPIGFWFCMILYAGVFALLGWALIAHAGRGPTG